MPLDVQISNEVSNDKRYIGLSQPISADLYNSTEFLHQL